MADTTEPRRDEAADRRPWWERHWVPILLAGLGVLGMLMGRWVPAFAGWYWGLLIPFFMIFSLGMEWRGRKEEQAAFWRTVGLQSLHWMGLALALWVLLLLEGGGRLPAASVSPIALLLLCLASYFAGVHFHRGFLVAAGLMVAALLVAAWFEKHLLWVLIAVIVWLVVQVIVVKRRAGRSPA